MNSILSVFKKVYVNLKSNTSPNNTNEVKEGIKKNKIYPPKYISNKIFFDIILLNVNIFMNNRIIYTRLICSCK